MSYLELGEQQPPEGERAKLRWGYKHPMTPAECAATGGHEDDGSMFMAFCKKCGDCCESGGYCGDIL